MDMSHGKGFIVLSMCLVIWKAVNFINSLLVLLFTYLIHLSFPMIDSHCRGGSRISSQGGGALNKIALSGGRHEDVQGISCEKSRFYAKKSYFFQFQGGALRVRPLGSVPALYTILVRNTAYLSLYWFRYYLM